MKQILLSIAVALAAAFPAFSQQTSLLDFIDKYRQDKTFSYAFLSKDMFEVAIHDGIEDKDWKKLHAVIRNIGSLRVLAADNLPSGQTLYKEALNAIPVADFDEILTVQDGSDKVRVWVKEASAVVTDLVLLVGTRDEFVLICFAGNLELTNLTDLVGLLDAAEVERLATTSRAIAPDFSMSPNPGSGSFILHCTEPDDMPQQMSVLDQNGRQLTELQLAGDLSQPVDLNDLPAGLYWIQLKTKKGKIGVKQLQIVK